MRPSWHGSNYKKSTDTHLYIKSDFVSNDLGFARGLVFRAQASRKSFTRYWSRGFGLGLRLGHFEGGNQQIVGGLFLEGGGLGGSRERATGSKLTFPTAKK